nr:hypothetical protein [Sulfurimonas sp.]
MSKKVEYSFSSIISIDPYMGSYLSNTSSFISDLKSIQFSKDQYIISYLNSKNFINSQISISKNILDDDLHDAIANKVYDELALDQTIAYQIEFTEIFNLPDEYNRNFYVFAIESLKIREIFKKRVGKIKYIDFIIPSPLLLKSLYIKDIVESDGVHCYIYFQKNDASVTIYNKKEFLYTKSINY